VQRLRPQPTDLREGGRRRTARQVPQVKEPRGPQEHGARALRTQQRPGQLHCDARDGGRRCPARYTTCRY